VHILGYYSACGPARSDRLEKVLQGIREARIRRAESIVGKLGSLGKPVTWGRVVAMAGAGVAPGRVHIARALLEAGHVHTFREAFNKYLYDGGPAYEQSALSSPCIFAFSFCFPCVLP
jgi:predicted metal-dependent phosphoesterase TrpH